MAKRWIPRVGERITLAGGEFKDEIEPLPSWTGTVEGVSKEDCKPGTVYVKIQDYGWTTARASEITIH